MEEKRKSCCDAIVKVKETVRIFKWMWGIIFLSLILSSVTLWASNNSLKLEYKVFSSNVELRLNEIQKDIKRIEKNLDDLPGKIEKLLQRRPKGE